MNEILRVENLSKSYEERLVLDSVSFSLGPGEHLGISGRSGSGKTTLMKCIMRLTSPDSGHIYLDGEEITFLKGKRLCAIRPRMQMIFQNPGETLNPRMKVRDIILEGARYHHMTDGGEGRLLSELLDGVSLRKDDLEKRPGELSGGEKARVAIARALALRPEVLITDEITSSLDASLRSGILSLLSSLSSAMIVISHDMKALEYVSERMLFMDGGRIYGSDSR